MSNFQAGDDPNVASGKRPTEECSMKMSNLAQGILGIAFLVGNHAALAQEELPVPTLYLSINMEAPGDQKVTFKIVEAPRPAHAQNRLSNPRYVTVRVHDKWNRDYSNPLDKGPLVGVIDAENPFLPLVDAAIVGGVSSSPRAESDPKMLIHKMKLAIRISLEGREKLLESIRSLRESSGISEAVLRAEAKNSKLKYTETSAYSKALLEFYLKVIQPGPMAIIEAFKIAEVGSKKERHQSLKDAKKIFLDAIRDSALKDSVIEGLLNDYANVVASLEARKGEIK
ncbi:MAG: hypothetical protein K2X47_11320 [Bdellovibrionales bacterium]|nr:hypothetical protein [Bdellovibrionales bacterium]